MVAKLSDAEIASAVASAGFPVKEHATAIAVVLAESGGNPNAQNKNRNGSTDDGLFQINSIHKQLRASGDVYNPSDNAKMAFKLWQERGWQPWVVYKTGKYALFLPRGRAAANNVENRFTEETKGNAIVEGVQTITDPGTWLRIAGFIVGGMLLLVALLRVTGTDAIIYKGAKLAATKGVR